MLAGETVNAANHQRCQAQEDHKVKSSYFGLEITQQQLAQGENSSRCASANQADPDGACPVRENRARFAYEMPYGKSNCRQGNRG
jgi:hypothetical protein